MGAPTASNELDLVSDNLWNLLRDGDNSEPSGQAPTPAWYRYGNSEGLFAFAINA